MSGVGTASSRVPYLDRSAEDRAIIAAYIDGGAGDGGTVAANERAWDGFAIVPRVLRTAGAADTTTSLFGGTWASPLIPAPVGGHGFFVPEAERAVAHAARDAGVLASFGHGATVPIEELAEVSGPYLQQIYLPRDRSAVLPFVERAVNAGAAGFLLTVDNQASTGHEPFRTDALPFLAQLAASDGPRGYSVGGGFAHDLSLADIAWFSALTDLPVLAKGVLDHRDAVDVVGAGAAGVVVSNHGGRQIDRSVTASEVLAEIRDAVGPSAIVLADGGIRKASDVLVALALGADGVLIGRPILHALREGGGEAVLELLADLGGKLAGLLEAMGRPSLSSLGPDAVRARLRLTY